MKKNSNVASGYPGTGQPTSSAMRKPEASARWDSLGIDRFAVKSATGENLFAHGDASHVRTGTETRRREPWSAAPCGPEFLGRIGVAVGHRESGASRVGVVGGVVVAAGLSLVRGVGGGRHRFLPRLPDVIDRQRVGDAQRLPP